MPNQRRACRWLTPVFSAFNRIQFEVIAQESTHRCARGTISWSCSNAIRVASGSQENRRDVENAHAIYERQLRSLLGSVSYLIIFLPGLSTTVQDLHSSLRKDVRFEFTAHHTAIAKKVLKQLVSSEVLAFPDFQAAIDGSRKLQLVTDASKGFGASSEQKQPDGTIRPLLYINRTTLPSEKNWNTSELECGALVWAI